MRELSQHTTLLGSTVRWGQELRRHVRFRVFGVVFKTSSASVEVLDLSLGGMSLKDSNYKEGEEYSGQIHMDSKVFNVKFVVRRIFGSFAGVEFLDTPEGLEDVITTDHFKKENFKVQLPKTIGNKLLYENDSKNIFLGFDSTTEGKIQEFFFCFQNVFVWWTQGEGVSTGLLINELSPSESWINKTNLKKDFIIDRNKIHLFEDIVSHNEKINTSLKQWIFETFDSLVL